MKRIIAACFAGFLLFAGAASAATPAQRIASLEKQVKALTATVKKQQAVISCIAKASNKCVTLKSEVNAVSSALNATIYVAFCSIADDRGRAPEHVDDARPGGRHATCSALSRRSATPIPAAHSSNTPGCPDAADDVGLQRPDCAAEPKDGGTQVRLGASAEAMSKKSRKGS